MKQLGQLASESGAATQAFDARYRAALVRQKQGRVGEAIDRLMALIEPGAQDPRTVMAHFRAIILAVELARSDDGELERYATLLQQHLVNWPQSPYADNVRLWYGALLESRRQWPAALDQYDRVSNASVEAWRQAVLSAAGIRMRQADAQYGEVQRRLEEALRQSTDSPPDWRTDAEVLLAVSFAGQAAHVARAAELLKRVKAPSNDAGLVALESLERIWAAAPDARRKPLAAMRLHLVGLMDPAAASLNAAQRPRFRSLRAAVLAAHGRRSEALADYRQLAQEFPADAAVQQGLAELLEDGEDPQSLAEALVQWRRVGRSCPVGSDRWYRAKYGVASVLYRQGGIQEAAQLIRYIQATQGLEATPLKPQFLDLLNRCRE